VINEGQNVNRAGLEGAVGGAWGRKGDKGSWVRREGDLKKKKTGLGCERKPRGIFLLFAFLKRDNIKRREKRDPFINPRTDYVANKCILSPHQ